MIFEGRLNALTHKDDSNKIAVSIKLLIDLN